MSELATLNQERLLFMLLGVILGWCIVRLVDAFRNIKKKGIRNRVIEIQDSIKDIFANF